MDERRSLDWQLERLAQGELDEAAARALELALGKEELAARLAALADSNREILERLPPQVVSQAIRRRLPARRSRRALWALLLAPAVAAGVFALTLRPGPPDEPGERVKGAPRLYAYRAATPGGRPTRLGPETRVRPHDLLQLAYTAGEARSFGIVLSFDGQGVVTQHLPLEATTAAPLAPTGETSLPRSYELDDSPGFERFFLITSAKPFALGPVLEAARALARSGDDARLRKLSLPPELWQESLLLEKVQP